MYIPPSQYKTGFYSNEAYIDRQGNIYTGPYYMLKNGKTYTGESPNNKAPGSDIQIFPTTDENPPSTFNL